ncbi:MAG: 16S rRNA (uracil1498-N3)-methyltransferase [Hyphomonadaceae bacterium]|nr:MAG: 16S rRNA (uracil1498-N3)-methyltransferase [Hyphomonadaceae bacterium]KAF0184252.1 MAG: 16S rRNA (uracil1498-N3)-methyltransferase [Hyphomonadaceae bacterium]
MKFVPRLFVDDMLGAGVEIEISKAHCHYLFNVLRLEKGESFLAFDGKNGEWRIEIIEASKKHGVGKCATQTRAQDTLPNLTLYFAPIKGHRNDAIIEKATELGAAHIVPIITEHTIVRKTNTEKMRQIVIEAAQQCERLCVPQIHEPISLEQLLANLDKNQTIIFADEAGEGHFDAHSLANASESIGLLVGPEGGFSSSEREMIRDCKQAIATSFGKRILRADTATYAGLTLIQALWGDWKKQT